jgi:hypothetical protein
MRALLPQETILMKGLHMPTGPDKSTGNAAMATGAAGIIPSTSRESPLRSMTSRRAGSARAARPGQIRFPERGRGDAANRVVDRRGDQCLGCGMGGAE